MSSDIFGDLSVYSGRAMLGYRGSLVIVVVLSRIFTRPASINASHPVDWLRDYTLALPAFGLPARTRFDEDVKPDEDVKRRVGAGGVERVTDMTIGTDPTTTTPAASDARPTAAGTSARPAHHAHAVLHCNLNTVDVERAAAFHMALFGGEPRMRSVSTDVDGTAMGLAGATSSVVTFLYDARGPRAAPALELVGWSRPRTEPPGPGRAPSGFTALGYRVGSLALVEARLAATGHHGVAVAGGVAVRDQLRPALRLADPDGVTIEVVEIPPSADDPRRAALLSHERMRCTDLERTVAWYSAIGWEVRSRGAGDAGPTASLVLPEDPTFSLEFSQRPAPTGATARWAANTQGLYRIALGVEDVAAAHASLVADGALGAVPGPATLPMPDVPTGGFTVMFLTDPDGAVVELVGRPRSAVRRPVEPR
jgi:catechol 2,3-dioxygenase-like lactoylglutathione lyase family enzyme